MIYAGINEIRTHAFKNDKRTEASKRDAVVKKHDILADKKEKPSEG